MSLIGIISEPSQEIDNLDRPAVLLLNAGLIHRVGPSRLHVRLARAFAAKGFLAMRFDLPGRGDSDVRRGAASSALSSLVDVTDAMDLLQRTHGVRRFIVAGICSGAGGAAEAASADPRVAGAVMINPYAYPTLQSRTRHYLRRLWKTTSWRNTLAGRNQLGRTLRRALRVEGHRAVDDAMLDAPESSAVPRHVAAGALREMVGREVRMFVIYSGGPGYNYLGQFEDAFSDVDFQGLLNVGYFPDADHTFTRLASQEQLEQQLVGWAERGFAPVPQTAEAPIPEVPSSGRERLAHNVLWSWASHLVFVAAGFVMPRLIDRQLGQATLGIWDFCWSLVGYFNLAQVGVGASVNRYVAAHRAVRDVAALNRTVSSVMAIQLIAAAIVLVLTAGAVEWLPEMFGTRLGTGMADAQWVVALLGLSLAVQLSLQVFRGVVTGCHRWDLHNQLDGVFYACSTAGMIAALLLGGGLRALAAIVLVGQCATDVARAALAYHVCSDLELRRRHVSMSVAWRMLAFGGKLSIAGIAEIVLVQTNSLLVLAHAGPTALAMYARPGALIRTVTTFGKKFSLVLVPTAGSMHSRGRQDELRDLLCETTSYAAFGVLPILVAFVVLGDALLDTWMGPGYRLGPVLTVLALGAVIPLTQQPAGAILMGMNRHGILAKAFVVAAALGTAAGVFTIGSLGWGLMGAALSVAGSASLTGMVVPVAACRAVDLPLARYLRNTYLKPAAAMVPYALTLMAVRALLDDPAAQLFVGLAVGLAVLAPIYWYWALPVRFRRSIGRVFASVLERLAISVPGQRGVARTARTAAASADLSVDVQTGWESFDTLKHEWNELLERSRANSIFLRWEWMEAWRRSGGEAVQPLLVIVRDRAGALAGIGPFYVARSRLFKVLPYRMLRVLGDYDSGAEYQDWIVRSDVEREAASAIGEALGRSASWDCAWMPYVAGWTGARDRVLEGYAAARAHRQERPTEFSAVDLPDDFDRYLKSLSGNARSMLKRRTQAIEQLPGTVMSACISHAERSTYLQALFDLHDRRWRASGQPGSFARRPFLARFYEEFSGLAFSRGWLRLIAIKANGQFQAVQFGYVYDRTFYQLQEGFDPEGPAGLGNVLRSYVIRDCIRDRVLTYDFLGGFTDHKQRWRAQPRSGHQLLLCRWSLRNLPLLLLRPWPTGKYFRPDELAVAAPVTPEPELIEVG